MRIAIIGAGNVGGGLGRAWQRVGHDVRWSFRAGNLEHHPAALPSDVVRDADVIVLAVPWSTIENAVHSLGDVRGRIVIDATNPIRRGDEGPELALGFSTSGAEEVARLAPGALVVKTLHQTGAENMSDAGRYTTPPVMFVAGDNAVAKITSMQLVNDLGFEALDAGPLRNARLLEPLAMLWISQTLRRDMGRDFAFTIERAAASSIVIPDQ